MVFSTASPRFTKMVALSCPLLIMISYVNHNWTIIDVASYLVNILQPISTKQFTNKAFFSLADWASIYHHNKEVSVLKIFWSKIVVYKCFSWWDYINLSWRIVSPPWFTNDASLSPKGFAWVCNKEEPLYRWRILRSNWWWSNCNWISFSLCFR